MTKNPQNDVEIQDVCLISQIGGIMWLLTISSYLWLSNVKPHSN